MTLVFEKTLPTEASLLLFASMLAHSITEKTVIFLYGPLGAGKTTFARGFLRGLGYANRVKSPTYSFVELYTVEKKTIVHVDLYRLQQAQELESLGLRDYFETADIYLIEWPERGEALLPQPDLTCHLSFSDHGRFITLKAHTPCGQSILLHHS